MAHPRRQREESNFDEKVVEINRVSKKTKGGNRMSFTALMVVGDKKGSVGVALGKAPDVLSAIKKGVRGAKKKMTPAPVDRDTIPFKIESKYGGAVVMLKPAPQGTGVIAGGAVRAVVEAAGIKNIVGKIMGSNNQSNNVYATLQALKDINKLVKIKGITIGRKSKDQDSQPKPATKNKPAETKKPKNPIKPTNPATKKPKPAEKPKKKKATKK